MNELFRRGIVVLGVLVAATPLCLADRFDPGAGPDPGREASLTLERGEDGTDQGAHEIEPGDSFEGTGTSPVAWIVDQTRSTFDTIDAYQLSQGRKLVDIEVRWNGSAERYSAVWYPVGGTIHRLIQGTTTEWNTFLSNMGAKNGRWLDVEVAYFGSNKRYSAIFYEDGDDYSYAIFTTNDDATFQSRLKTYADDGRQIIDFESYEDSNGATRYAGVWVHDPNQPKTHLVYGLEWSDISSMLSPMQGRIIDVERYKDESDRIRYAVILQPQSGGGWGVYRHISSTTLGSLNTSISDSDTHLIDVETYNNGGSIQHIAIWGNNYKSLNTHPSITTGINQPLGSTLSSLLSNFENSGARVGLYAKNVRTNQALAWRPDEMFYLASATKTAVLIKMWQEIQEGRLAATQQINYTNSTATGAPWYMDERNSPGFDNAVCNTTNDFGQSFPVTDFAQAMMQVSDNGATSALVDSSVVGVSRDSTDLNEWLAGLSGVGQGWGLVTSIQNSDRYVGRHSQIASLSNDISLFTAPAHTIRPFLYGSYRRCNTTGARCSTSTSCPLACPSGQSCNVVRDPWGDMAAYASANGASMPSVSFTNSGYARYYNTGINSATPRALSNLLEKLVSGAILDSTNTMNAWNQMDEGTNLDNGPGFPPITSSFGGSGVWVQAKGGTQNGASGPCTDSATFSMGPDTVVVSLLTKDNNFASCGGIRTSLTAPVGVEVLRLLAADLEDCGGSSGNFGPTTLRPGDAFDVFTDVCNTGGGNGYGFSVDFYASTNASINIFQDTFLGRVFVGGIAAGSGAPARVLGTLPDLAPGTYYIGWNIDATPNDNHGSVGEFDESNNVDVLPFTITVQPALVPVDGLRFGSETGLQWNPVGGAADYTVFEGDGSTLPDLANGSLDSCDRTTSTGTSTNVSRIPAPGQLLWYLVAAEGDGPLEAGSLGPRLLDSTGTCGDSCPHDLCTGSGGPLEPACDPCVAAVCEADPFCCDTNWDFACVDQVLSVCGIASCPLAVGSCTHSICEIGGVLAADCDDPPISPSCVADICAVDPYCCNTAWDGTCVNEVTSVCGLNCM